MASSNAFTIRSRGSLISVIDSKLFATLLGEQNSVFTAEPVGDGSVTLKDKDSGKAVTVPGPEHGAQLGTGPQAATWVLRQITEDDDEPVQVADVTESGHYTLELAGTGMYAGRALAEDYSLMPKRIILTRDEGEPARLVLHITN
jgi:hypothetical protein